MIIQNQSCHSGPIIHGPVPFHSPLAAFNEYGRQSFFESEATSYKSRRPRNPTALNDSNKNTSTLAPQSHSSGRPRSVPLTRFRRQCFPPGTFCARCNYLASISTLTDRRSTIYRIFLNHESPSPIVANPKICRDGLASANGRRHPRLFLSNSCTKLRGNFVFRVWYYVYTKQGSRIWRKPDR